MKYHKSVEDILRFFEFSHLPSHLKDAAQLIHGVAHCMARDLEGPELTVGLRKLLEAKDCFVRASLAAQSENSPK